MDTPLLYDTKFAEAYYTSGLAYLSLKKDKESCHDFKKVLELANKDAILVVKDFCKYRQGTALSVLGAKCILVV